MPEVGRPPSAWLRVSGADGVAREPDGSIDAGFAGGRQEGGFMADRADPGAWQRVKQRLRAELGEDVFSSWFGRAEFESADKSAVYLSVPTRFLKSWIGSHYNERLLALWTEERPGTIQIEIIVRGSVRTKASAVPSEIAADMPAPLPAPPRRRAGSGIAASTRGGRSLRRLAGRPALHVRELLRRRHQPRGLRRRPGGRGGRLAQPFNPLYIHAGVGRGKTHLLHAVTRAARRADPSRKVVYLTAEHFMFRMVAAIRNQTAIQFKETLRDIDLLLIDDMQFLQGKSVQQEFCHMLNALIDGARQVVVAADRPPAELETLDERVRSRLKGGVAFEIGAPDLDLRRRIIAIALPFRAGAESRPRRARAGARIRGAVGGLERPRPRGRAQPPGRPVAVHQPDRDAGPRPRSRSATSSGRASRGGSGSRTSSAWSPGTSTCRRPTSCRAGAPARSSGRARSRCISPRC